MTLETPTVSVIMAVRNEAAFIERSLGAVLQQDYPPQQLQVLIADGLSGDETRTFIARLVADCPAVDVRVLDNYGLSTARGLNLMLSAVRGDIIVRVDGHTIIAPDYVRACVSALQNHPADAVGGRMSAVGLTYFGQAVALATSSAFGVGGGRFHYSDQDEWVDTVYLGAWRRELFQRLGYFDVEMGCNEDDEFHYRIRARGGRILLSSQIRSVYYNRNNWRALWKQYYRYGFWKVDVLRKHPLQMRPRQFVPAIFVGGLIGGLPFALSHELLLVLWLDFAILYALLNVIVSVRIARRAGWHYGLLLPLVFFTLHMSYGTGVIFGSLKALLSRNPVPVPASDSNPS